MNKPDGGAIGVVSASRKVFAGPNATLHQAIFRNLFLRDSFGRVIVERPGTAIYVTKATRNDDNDKKFFYMGDPTMHLQFPLGFGSIDSINGESVDSAAVQLRALSRTTVNGSKRDQNNLPDTSYAGSDTVSLTVNDASRRIVIQNFWPGGSWSYIATGGTIYRGDVTATKGRFAGRFVVPRDISYADTTTNGRLVAYIRNETSDGVGYTTMVRVSGTDSTAGIDEQGPAVSIYLGNRAFRAGDVVGESPMMYVDLADSNGINVSGVGIGHRIEAWVNNSEPGIDLSEFYRSKLDDFREGTVQYRLSGLPYGRNTIRLRAWDTYNNSGTAETFFTVSPTDQLRLFDVFNYPNPFSSGTMFTMRQNLLTPLNVVVKIYTLAGRLVQSLETLSAGESFVRVPWDGRDRDGDVLANGVYLYKVIAKTTDGRFSSEALGKVSVLR
jgi:hypothetical protein